MEKIGDLTLSNSPAETFNIIILDALYKIDKQWNTTGDFWTVSVELDGVSIVQGIKIVEGVFIFDQYPQIDFDILVPGGKLITRKNLSEIVLGVYKR